LKPIEAVRELAALAQEARLDVFRRLVQITTIILTVRYAPARVAAAVASYIMAAYWFTASTSFANPAVTVARSVTDTFAGIRPLDAPAFILAQLCGAVAAMLVTSWLMRVRPR